MAHASKRCFSLAEGVTASFTGYDPELDEAVAVDDLAWGRGEVLARCERCGVGYAEPALAKIVQQVAEPVG